MGHETPIKQRLYITFGKFGALKYTGNLDVAKIWERVLRRADLPILYTQGFNTRPRMQLATALPLGITSECEILDVSLRERLADLADMPERLAAVSPAGLRIYKVDDMPVKSPPLQRMVSSAEYRFSIEDEIDGDDLQTRINRVLAADEIIREKVRKKGRKTTIDLRAMIYDLRVDDDGALIAHLAAGERGNFRPEELMMELGLEDHHYSAHRFRLHLDHEGV
jgi:radical SAM-linked protein